MSHVPQIAPGEIRRVIDARRPNEQRMTAIGVLLVGQVKDRFATAGESGGSLWPQKKMKDWGYDDGRAILTGPTSQLLESFQSSATRNEVVLFSDRKYSRVQQLGTVGKGGALPTIKPKRAKALFIPITDRAIASYLPGGGSIRIPDRGPKVQGKPGVFTDLVKGRLKDGKLQKWDAEKGEYVAGVPDFIFLSKIDIPPRPMLPNGAAERQSQNQFIIDTLSGPIDPINTTPQPIAK